MITKSSDFDPIKSGVSEGSVLGPILYLIFMSELPKIVYTTTGIFADNTPIYDDPLASLNLQNPFFQLEESLRKWNIRINKFKSQYVTLTV